MVDRCSGVGSGPVYTPVWETLEAPRSPMYPGCDSGSLAASIARHAQAGRRWGECSEAPPSANSYVEDPTSAQPVFPGIHNPTAHPAVSRKSSWEANSTKNVETSGTAFHLGKRNSEGNVPPGRRQGDEPLWGRFRGRVVATFTPCSYGEKRTGDERRNPTWSGRPRHR